MFFFLELLYCVSQSCQIPLPRMFRNRIPVARTSIADELRLPGDRQHAQETDLITGWTLNKDCKNKRKVLEVVSQYFGVFSQAGDAGTMIPVVVDSSLTLNARSFMAFFTLEREKIGRMGESRLTEMPVPQQPRLVLCAWECSVPSSLCGGQHRPSCSATPAPPDPPGAPVAHPRAHSISLRGDTALAPRERRNVHGLVL